MAMILDAFMSKFSTLLADLVHEEFIKQLGVKDELQTLRRRMKSIQCLLEDAERKKFNESSSIELWLSKLKNVMYDAEDIIDLCRIKGPQLLADQNLQSRTFSVCGYFSSAISCCKSVPLRHEIGNNIKDINKRLDHIYEDRKRYKLEISMISKTPQFTLPDSHKTSSLVDSYVVGREVDDVANSLVDRLVGEKVDEKCSVFAVTGMGGIGKTTLAKKIFNHKKIQTYFNEKVVWVCVSETYVEIELLKQVIRGVNGNYGDVNTKAELEPILRDSIALVHNLFLVLDDVWRGNVWDELLRVPLQQSNVNVKVLVTTRYENVAKEMKAVDIHQVDHLSEESSWDMLRMRLFSEQEEELANDLKELGLKIVNKCEGLPLAIKVIAGALGKKERTKKAWQIFLKNYAWSNSELFDEQIRGALRLSFEDLPSHLKQCFLYFSLYPEDAELNLEELSRLWVAEGFVTEQQNSLMEDSGEEYFNELLMRNLLLPEDHPGLCRMHDLIRYLAIFYSKEETSFGALNVRNSTTSNKLRRLSVANHKAAVEVLDSVADQGALRTLLASNSDLLLNDERLRRLSHLRVLDISHTRIQLLPDSIGSLMHLKYLNLNFSNIATIPESIGKLANLQFLYICLCENLRQLPSGITLLHNLRCLVIDETPVSFIPKGIEKLQQLNSLRGFVVANNNSSSSKWEDLNSLKQIRELCIKNLQKPQSETIVLKDLPNLSTLTLWFSMDRSSPHEEQESAVEELFDRIIPPQSLEEFHILYFFGRRFPSWMFPSFKICLPNLTKLLFRSIASCTQLPSLGELPELKELHIDGAKKVKKIGPEFFGGDVNSTMIAFPKLKQLFIFNFPELEEWSFGAQVEQNARLPCLQELKIKLCPLLKQLPEYLKYSPMKFLEILGADSLKSIDNLPAEIESLELSHCENLKKVCCPPTLKQLAFEQSNFNFDDQPEWLLKHYKDNLPEWLLKLLQQQKLQNDSNDDFYLELNCGMGVFRECLKGGSYWDLIQHIPQVNVFGNKHYLQYRKQPYVYDTNL